MKRFEVFFKADGYLASTVVMAFDVEHAMQLVSARDICKKVTSVIETR